MTDAALAPERNYLTIVSGLPRSGTSLMMQLLAAGGIPPVTDNQRTPDEDNPRGYFEFEKVKKLKTDTSWIPGAQGKLVKMVHLLLLDLPLKHSYRVVFMRRNLDEVVKSQSIMLQRQGKSGAALHPDKLKALYTQQIDQVQAHMTRHPQQFAFTEISYKRLVEDPPVTVMKLCEFLGGGLDPAAMVAAVDPKLYRNRA